MNVTPVLPTLATKKNLKKLAILLKMNTDEYEHLTRAVQNENLEVLMLATETGQMFPPELMTALAPVLSSHKSLIELYLRPFAGRVGWVAVCDIIRNNRLIQHITMADDYGCKMTVEDMADLCSVLTANTILHSIFLSKLSDTASQFFAILAHNRSKLTHITITLTEFDQEAIRVLSESLKTNTLLVHLELKHCTIDGVTCQILCEGLLQNKHVTNLQLRYADLGMIGVKSICDLLTHNDSLKTLHLQGCNIDPELCQSIAQMLSTNTSLSELSLDDNKFGDQGTLSICETMAKNTTLRTLKLMDVGYGVEGLTGVKKMLMSNNTLCSLSVTPNYEFKEEIDAICEGLKCNQSLTRIEIKHTCYFVILNQQIVSNLLTKAIQGNYALEFVELDFIGNDFAHLFRRNKQLKSEVRCKVSLLSHNIARSERAMEMLPREIWRLILSSVTHTSMDLCPLIQSIFNLYNK